MGINVELRAISHSTSLQLLADPAKIHAHFYEFNRNAPPGSENSVIDLDKAWHALHFLLTGTSCAGEGPIAFLLVGGAEIPGAGTGYVPPRILSAVETAAFAQALDSTPERTIRARYDPQSLARSDIYPDIWLPDHEGTYAYVQKYYDSLRTFVTEAARNKLCLLIVMS